MKLVTGAAMFALAMSASAQTVPAPRQTPTGNAAMAANPTAAGLGRGWAALAAGRNQEALAAAQQLLRGDPADHDALSLAIAALTAGQQSSRHSTCMSNGSAQARTRICFR